MKQDLNSFVFYFIKSRDFSFLTLKFLKFDDSLEQPMSFNSQISSSELNFFHKKAKEHMIQELIQVTNLTSLSSTQRLQPLNRLTNYLFFMTTILPQKQHPITICCWQKSLPQTIFLLIRVWQLQKPTKRPKTKNFDKLLK